MRRGYCAGRSRSTHKDICDRHGNRNARDLGCGWRRRRENARLRLVREPGRRPGAFLRPRGFAFAQRRWPRRRWEWGRLRGAARSLRGVRDDRLPPGEEVLLRNRVDAPRSRRRGILLSARQPPVRRRRPPADDLPGAAGAGQGDLTPAQGGTEARQWASALEAGQGRRRRGALLRRLRSADPPLPVQAQQLPGIPLARGLPAAAARYPTAS